MTILSRGALVLMTILSSQSAQAADQAAVAAQHGGPPPVVYAPPPPPVYLLPPCWDSFWGPALLQCVPRTVVAPSDDLYTQNAIRGLRPTKRKPYIQLFTW